ncbi:MAG TPA: S41 family peptidase [Acidimicrobiia bacterium]|nr:S41 family peptidase [Acidimicrobiia bacterium]
MTRAPYRRLTWTLLLVLVVSSCTVEDTPEPTPGISQTTSAAETPSSTVEGASRTVRMVGCDPADSEVEIVCEAYDLVRRHYVDDVSDQDLAEAASLGLLELGGTMATSELVCAAPAVAFQETCEIASGAADSSSEAAEAMVWGLTAYGLDANSVYFDAAALELVEDEQEGEIEGIGALVRAEDSSSGESVLCSVISETCHMLILSTIAGTPAERAGLQRDDVIVEVDGQDIRGQTIDEVTANVRGPAGTDVTLKVDRAGTVFDVAITRAAVVVPAVVSEVVGNTGYVALNLFTDNADDQFQAAVSGLLDQGVDSLVVDLRDNPGGLLDTSIEVTSLFLPDGDVVITESPDTSTSYPVSGHPIVPEDIDLILVVNRASASASEVVAAVLQERGRATVVGENTFGKNTVQQRFGLSNGGAIKLTIARWLTPGGVDFGEIGVTPDVLHEIDFELSVEKVVEEALAAAVTADG